MEAQQVKHAIRASWSRAFPPCRLQFQLIHSTSTVRRRHSAPALPPSAPASRRVPRARLRRRGVARRRRRGPCRRRRPVLRRQGDPHPRRRRRGEAPRAGRTAPRAERRCQRASDADPRPGHRGGTRARPAGAAGGGWTRTGPGPCPRAGRPSARWSGRCGEAGWRASTARNETAP